MKHVRPSKPAPRPKFYELNNFVGRQPPAASAAIAEALEPFIARRKAEGGALPVS